MADGVLFDRQSAAKISDTVRRSWPRGHVPGPAPANAYGLRPPVCGVLLEDLDAASDPLTGATWARAQIYAVDPFNEPTESEPRKLQEVAREEQVVNRDVDATALSGTFFVAMWVNAEWLIIWLGCGPADEVSGSDGSGGGGGGGGGGTLGGTGGGLGSGGLGGS